MIEPSSLETLIANFSSLPGIGGKTARRLTYYMLSRPRDEVAAFSSSLLNAVDRVHPCKICYSYTEDEICPICRARAGMKVLCVVEKSFDIIPFERSGIYGGLYHVLGGVLSPLDGIGSDELHIPELIARIKNDGINEIIFALGSSPEAESTVLLIDRLLTGMNVKRSRLARGIPMGSDLEFVDEVTMLRAFEGRVSL